MKSNKTISSKLKLYSGPSVILSWIKSSNGKLLIPKRNQKDFWRDLSRLKKDGLIETKTTSKMVQARLTKLGELEFLRIKIFQTGPLPDGQVCVVVFDIPEKNRTERKLLRSLLKEFDFERIQKSVWFSLFDAAEPLVDFFKATKVDKWIMVFVAKEII
jgi:DNA-binding transcriptional regulator PaaX